VVTVGETVIEEVPVTLPTPPLIESVSAPVTVQVSVELDPELMAVGFAVNELIAGLGFDTFTETDVEVVELFDVSVATAVKV
jgi:hypothetical protein